MIGATSRVNVGADVFVAGARFCAWLTAMSANEATSPAMSEVSLITAPSG
jgi:hypothetical protein